MPKLKLGRREGERVLIRTPRGEEVWVTLEGTKGGRQMLTIEAPSEIQIWRGELVAGPNQSGERQAGDGYAA